MRVATLALIVATIALAGCADAPFVERELTSTLDKPINTILENGKVSVCYTDATSWAEVEAEAAYACAEYGYFSRFVRTQRYQCRISAPHLSIFACYHPEMTDIRGKLINPSDEKAIAAWQKRTGKMKPKLRVALPESQQPEVPATLPQGPQAAATDGAAANTPTMTTPTTNAAPTYRPLTPADIAGKPGMAPAPVLAEPPPPAPLYPSGGGFTLPQDSWGQHFEN